MNVSTEEEAATHQTEHLELTLESQQSRRDNDSLLMEMEAKKRSFGLIVPTSSGYSQSAERFARTDSPLR